MTTKILCILDGFGLTTQKENNAIYKAKMPHFRSLLKNYNWFTLDADGDGVGQETGLVGNSEVGHMNMGGLKLIPQLSYQITKSSVTNFDLSSSKWPDQNFDPKDFLKTKFNSPKSKVVHLVGLFSRGTIHADFRHWAGAIESAGKSGAEQIVLHFFSDGRDVDPQSLVSDWEYFLETFVTRIKAYKDLIVLGSLGGRFYAMDRDKNWDRVFRGVLAMLDDKEFDIYNNPKIEELLTEYDISLHYLQGLNYKKNPESWFGYCEPSFFESEDNFDKISQILSNYTKVDCYQEDIFDEHLIPVQISYDNKNEPFKAICKGDTVWVQNFRSDRARQLTEVLIKLNAKLSLELDIITNNDYGVEGVISETNSNQKGSYYSIFKTKPIEETLAKFISKQDKNQLHIAETEKYNHVTYFFNGGQNKQWPGEDWQIIPSNKVTSHAEKPAMKAEEVTDYILDEGLGKYDYIIVNYANPDMVGHTGDLQAAIESMEFLDKQLGRLLQRCQLEGHKMLVTADHGNVEVVGEYYTKGQKHIDTQHNPNPVPFVIVDNDFAATMVLQKLGQAGLIDDQLSANLKSSFAEDNKLDITQKQEAWLTVVPEPKLSLFTAGVILLGL